MRWNECLSEHIARHNTTDEETVNRLKQQSKNTLASMKRLKADQTTSRSKALLAYDALRELLEALSHKEGYDIHNHECYRAFLQEIMGASDLAQTFDDLRQKRNDLEYDADHITVDETKTYVEQATATYHDIKSLF